MFVVQNGGGKSSFFIPQNHHWGHTECFQWLHGKRERKRSLKAFVCWKPKEGIQASLLLQIAFHTVLCFMIALLQEFLEMNLCANFMLPAGYVLSVPFSSIVKLVANGTACQVDFSLYPGQFLPPASCGTQQGTYNSTGGLDNPIFRV